MIIEFSIENFGSIKEKQTLSFEADESTHLEESYVVRPEGGPRLLKLALIYGANASGKTTILKALDFLRDLVMNPIPTKTGELDYNPFLFDEKTASDPSNLSIKFIHQGIVYLYEVEFFKRAVVSESLYFYDPNKAIVYKRSTNLESQYAEIHFGSKIKKGPALLRSLTDNTLWNNTVLGGYLKTNVTQPQLKAVFDWFNDYLSPIVSSRTQLEHYIVRQILDSQIAKNDIVRILKMADFNISDFKIERSVPLPETFDEVMKNVMKATDEQIDQMRKDPPRQIYFEHKVDGKIYELPIDLESEGTRRYFEFAGLLSLMIKSGIAVPIDELESSLHPDLYVHFILSFLLNSKQSQLIATTHYREILGNKDIFRNDAIWFTDKSESCATDLYSLADFDTSVVRDTSNILNAYRSGKLKGIPNLGDPYIQLTK